MTKVTPAAANGRLIYDAARELLTGQIGGLPFSIKAFSGGGRGSKDPKVPQTSLESKLSTTKTLKDKHGNYVQRGGTLPAGEYECLYVADHRHFHECVRLKALTSAKVITSPFASRPFIHGRGDDFYIHGRGKLGSDGCIVPESNGQRLKLNHAIKFAKTKIILEVINVGYSLPAENFRPGDQVA